MRADLEGLLMASSIIDVKGLVKKYGERVAVNGVDLSILEEEIFGLLGPKRPGKTRRFLEHVERLEAQGMAVLYTADEMEDNARSSGPS